MVSSCTSFEMYSLFTVLLLLLLLSSSTMTARSAVRTGSSAGSFYNILGVDKKADDQEIKRAYRKLAMKWHPDKNRDNVAVAEKRFKEINEAYETLSDKKKRGIYDLYGEDALKNPQAAQFHQQGSPFGDFNFQRSQQSKSFNFGGESMADMMNEMFGQFFGGNMGGSTEFNFGSGRMPKRQKDVSAETPFYCTLEELYSGCKKKLKIRDELPLFDGRMAKLERVVEVDVSPGWKEGTKVTFQGVPEFPKAITLVLKEQRHKYFERRGNDLRWACRLTKRQVKNGVIVNIPMLDGTKITFNTVGMNIKSGSSKLFKGMGMPITSREMRMKRDFEGQQEEKTHGDLIVKFEIVP